MLCVGLCAVADLSYDSVEGDGAAVCHSRAEGLLFHEVGEDAGVGAEAGDGDAHVCVDFDDFFLVRGEFFCVSLHGISFALFRR